LVFTSSSKIFFVLDSFISGKRQVLPYPLFSVWLLRLPVEERRNEGDEEDEAVDAEDDHQHLAEVLDLLGDNFSTSSLTSGQE